MSRAALVLAAVALGCALRGPDAPDPEPAPGPLLGSSVPTVLALVKRKDPGARVSLEALRVSRMDGDFWRDVPVRTARRPDFEAESDVHYAVVALRVCKRGLLDFEGRPMGSWFLFRGNALVAFQHQGFTPRCDTLDHFAPAPLELLREEREVRGYAGQRHPQPRPSPQERFERGFAYFDVNRIADAERMHRAGSHALEIMIRDRKDRRLPMDEDERALRLLRARLKRTLDDERVAREGTRGPEEEFFRGTAP